MEAKQGTTRYSWHAMLDFASALFEAAGMRPDDARHVATTLVQSDLRGVMSHGLVRLPVYFNNLKTGVVNPVARPNVVSESDGTALVDGQNAMGQVVAAESMNVAIAMASRLGVGVVVARNSNHFGACGNHALEAVDRGMVGIAMSNAAAGMAPWGGIDPIIGNNPFAVAIPSPSDAPIVLDMALTTAARGKIKLARVRGEPIPLGWGLDGRGKPTSDPAVVMGQGSAAPMGGHKGYGLAVIVDLLAAGLSGAAFSPERESMGFAETGGRGPLRGPEAPGERTGHWFLALDIARFLPLDEFRRRAAGYATMLRTARLAEGATGIYLPGELEQKTEEERRAEGIPYEADVVGALSALGAQESLDVPEALRP